MECVASHLRDAMPQTPPTDQYRQTRRQIHTSGGMSARDRIGPETRRIRGFCPHLFGASTTLEVESPDIDSSLAQIQVVRCTEPIVLLAIRYDNWSLWLANLSDATKRSLVRINDISLAPVC
ncbi:unnamed protein product [Toxocara canis]|uniref:Pecanex-like protein n=1 Tax=Toxocara canis TaxID=6265 RepID=A0A183UF34_TOXCA|nr:unnamed protein product [Toxocara canis]